MKKILKIAALVLIPLACAGGWYFYSIYYKPAVHTTDKAPEIVLIHTGSTFNDLVNELSELKIIDDTANFRMLSGLKNFTEPKPGRYRLKDGMSMRELINMLRSGNQEAIDFTFNNIRTKEQLASRVGGKLEADSARFLFLLNDANFLSKYGLTTDNIMTMFIPNTYQLYWNTSEEQFFDRMAAEYKTFWNADRKAKAAKLNMSQSEVMILASIVEAEQTQYAEERPKIAGLYINRIKQNMPLQSDPTVIYALGDFSIKRVLNNDLEVDSPYNTYKHTGLPPGPIRIPDPVSVDAVLDYDHNDYIYMCAEYGTGHHKFATSLTEHNRNAAEFQAALNKANIKR